MSALHEPHDGRSSEDLVRLSTKHMILESGPTEVSTLSIPDECGSRQLAGEMDASFLIDRNSHASTTGPQRLGRV